MTKECEDNKSGHQGESVGGTAASPPFITMMKEGAKKDKNAEKEQQVPLFVFALRVLSLEFSVWLCARVCECVCVCSRHGSLRANMMIRSCFLRQNRSGLVLVARGAAHD